MKILHIGGNEIFLPPLIKIINKNFKEQEHEFILTSQSKVANNYENVKFYPRSVLPRLFYYLNAWIGLIKSSKIILHGLFDIKLLLIIILTPWCLKKCCWVLWGGDLYAPNMKGDQKKYAASEIIRGYVIKNLGFITTMVPGDYLLAKKWYNTKAKFIPNLMYLSHIARNENSNENKINKSELYIQVGNSSDPSNNHEEVLVYLSKINNKNFKVFCPLAYGCEETKNKIIKIGEELLGDKFVPITNMMNFEEYNDYMARIDIAIFNHDRQQAMGNIIGLLSLGKKVAIKETITPYHYLTEMGVKTYIMNEGLMMPIDENIKISNKNLMKSNFNENKLISNWKSVFDEK